jgi:PPOX class probable F420-dependent enzyme
MPFELSDQTRRRIDEEHVIWLTTVTASGRPTPRPVWFVWDEDAFLIYSEPDTAKVAHVRAGRAAVSLNFNTDPGGGDVVVIAGHAEVLDDVVPPTSLATYLEKYADGITSIGMDRTTFDATYHVALRVTPEQSWSFPA